MIFTIKITTLEGCHLKIEGDSKKYMDLIISEYWDQAKEIQVHMYKDDKIEYIK